MIAAVIFHSTARSESLDMASPSRRLWRRGASKRSVGPDEGTRVGRLWRRKSVDKPKTCKNKTTGTDFLTTLPHEILFGILTFLSASEVDGNVKLVCQSMRRECASAALWRFLCDQAGKSIELMNKAKETGNAFRDLYYEIPCVPTDFASITSALSRCPVEGTITLLPGVYEERLEIRKSVHIRAAFPEKGAAVVWYKGVNEPCIAVVEDGIGNVSVMAHLSNVQLLHSTDGSDIWGGNCAIMVEGRRSRLNLKSCCIQSQSGRGVVAVNGSFLQVEDTVIHDCAATGLYLGDHDSIANVKGCNFIRNGGGSRRPLPTDEDGNEEDDLDRVPAGHSGMYVEAGRAFVEDSLVAGNFLTGLSIVRGGGVIVSGCDITENGSDAILVEDAVEHAPTLLRNRRPIGIEEGPARNNYSSRTHSGASLQDVIHSLVDFGGTVRATQFMHVVTNKLMTIEAHESRYRATGRV